jgi:hypothetical protein
MLLISFSLRSKPFEIRKNRYPAGYLKLKHPFYH